MPATRVLSVDAESLTGQELGDLLESEEYTVLVGVDGTDGLARGEVLRPDVILLEAMQPGVDGSPSARSSRRIPRPRPSR